MSVRRALSVTGTAAVQLLRLTQASVDVLPPLKSAAEGALYIAELASVRLRNVLDWHVFSPLNIEIQDKQAGMARVPGVCPSCSRNHHRLALQSRCPAKRDQAEPRHPEIVSVLV
jgi:hypothetical protein